MNNFFRNRELEFPGTQRNFTLFFVNIDCTPFLRMWRDNKYISIDNQNMRSRKESFAGLPFYAVNYFTCLFKIKSVCLNKSPENGSTRVIDFQAFFVDVNSIGRFFYK